MYNEDQADKNCKIIIQDTKTSTLWTINTKQTRIDKIVIEAVKLKHYGQCINTKQTRIANLLIKT